MSKIAVLWLTAAVALSAAGPTEVGESDRRLPVSYKVDVVVAGGSSGAVAAAVAAAQMGARVFLLAPRPYLGEDMCASMRLWLEPGEKPAGPLALKLFNEPGPLRPLHVKKTLDEALLGAGVEFLYSSYPTELLRDAGGRVSGLVMANRTGRQAVVAKVIIDASARGALARMAGAQFQPWPAGLQTFRRVVAGGEAKPNAAVTARKTGLAYRGDGSATSASAAPVELIEYTLRIPISDASYASFARAEQVGRDLTGSEAEQANTEEMFQVPPDPIQGAKAIAGSWPGVEHLDLGAFRPAGVDGIFILSGIADMPRPLAAKLLRPLALIEMGARIGEAAAVEAKNTPEPREPAVRGRRRIPVASGDVKESLAGVRPASRDLPSLASFNQSVPVIGSYDVVIAGGGTAGATATISAARAHGRTLVIEYLHGLGGVGTQGMISKYWWGNRIGFAREVPGVLQALSLTNPVFAWSPLQKAEWLRRTARQAGAEIWFGAVVCGAYVEGSRVKGVVVATPEGRGVVLAKTVIDATGNADVAAPAGALTVVTDSSEIAQQGVGLPHINLNGGYTNTDFTLTDDTDLVDIWHLFVYAKNLYGGAFDMGQLVDSRERRRIVGDFELSLEDELTGRNFPDTIVVGFSDFDTHGYAIDPLLLLEWPGRVEGIPSKLPYRCLLPKGLEGILVAGIAVSAHRDASPSIRMQPEVENQGYAAGLAAVMAAKAGGTRSIDVRELQKELVAHAALPERVLKESDSFPLSAARVAEAVANPKGMVNLAVLLSHPEVSSPLLRQAYQQADPADKVTYAMILAVLGDSAGLPTLMAEFEAAGGPEGRDFKPMDRSVRAASRLDDMVAAMGRTRDHRALAPILSRASRLDAGSAFGHYRAVTLALEMIDDRSAAATLAQLLSKPGIAGHAVTSVDEAKKLNRGDPNDWTARQLSLREIGLARVLFRLGDQNGLARHILTCYAQDLRGHFSRHAQAVLEEKR